MVVKAGAQVNSILLNYARTELMPSGIAVTRLVLRESFLGSFAGHPDIQAFEYPIELRIGFAKFTVFTEDLSAKFDYVYPVHLNVKLNFSGL